MGRVSPTEHGQNIADQIQTEDAYGAGPGKMNLADVWLILDNLQTHFMDTGQDKYATVLSRWMREIDSMEDK